jgi:hypothetical protein
VVGFTGQARVARLGQRPLSQPIPPVPLNPLIRWTARKPRGKKDYASGLGRVPWWHTGIREPCTDSHSCSSSYALFVSLIVIERSQLGIHGVGSMASALQIGFYPKGQHFHSNRYCHALMTAGLHVGSSPSRTNSP